MGKLLITITLLYQTAVSPTQTRPTVAVVEWAKCNAYDTANDPPKWDCRGMELYRFRLADGTLRGPYIAVMATPLFTLDVKWQVQAIK